MKNQRAVWVFVFSFYTLFLHASFFKTLFLREKYRKRLPTLDLEGH